MSEKRSAETERSWRRSASSVPSRRRKKGSADLYKSDRLDLPAPILAIIDEHKYVSRLLPLIEKEADNIRSRSDVDLGCLNDVLHYLVNYPDLYHHPKEDLIFDRMADQSTAVKRVITRLRRDHEASAKQGKELLEEVTRLRESGTRRIPKKLADNLTGYAVSMRNHMSMEESTIFEPALKSLQPSDWEAIDEAIKPQVDPMFGQSVSERYMPLMLRYINDFDSVYKSGTFPTKLVESLASRLEQRIYAAMEVREFFRLVSRSSKAELKRRSKLFFGLRKIRSLAAAKHWQDEFDDARKEFRDDLFDLFEQLENAIEAAGKPVHTASTQNDLTIIKLHSENELREFQETPYAPMSNPQTSWQAAMMNLLIRMTLKPMMRHLSLERMKTFQRVKVRDKKPFVPADTTIEKLKNKDFRAEWIIPKNQNGSRRTVMHLPGGGFITAASNMHRAMLGMMANRLQSPVLLVHYRLLPEHPFPAGLEDALTAYRHLLEEGIPAEEIVISGDSAGGCLTLALLLAVREEGLPMPGAAVLISPLTDLTFSTPARTTNRWRDPMLPNVRKAGAYFKYAGDHSVDEPLVSPIYGSYENFPPIFALVSSTETLLDDTLVVARKARSQGVDCEVEVWHNLPHVWTLFTFLPETHRAIANICNFIESKVTAKSTATEAMVASA